MGSTGLYLRSSLLAFLLFFLPTLQLLSKHVSVTGFITEEVRPTQTSGRRSSRIGFDVVLLSELEERRATLARCTGHETTTLSAHAPRVGQYVVQLSSFESLALPCLQASVWIELSLVSCFNFTKSHDLMELFVLSLTTLNSLSDRNASGPSVCIIDEIGKMELCSPSFCVEIEKLTNLISTISKQSSRVVLVATVPSARRPDGRRGIPLVDALCSRPNVCLFEVSVHWLVSFVSLKSNSLANNVNSYRCS
ncbi:Nucleoside-triphosphatase THEP1 [Paragonimus heterotremus]|uniref:Nucleoside-triphosphatase THEP1 n=1 Tax=Paragonimus heterotremus TaxID=100268 RepID=A0A8J4WG03_9TREM|nr:Nucleoside-triphosphatase THEP1 [Paragonimus heterotremus]